MKKLQWFKVGDLIPSDALCLNKERVIVDTYTYDDHPQGGSEIIPDTTHIEYLYEVPERRLPTKHLERLE